MRYVFGSVAGAAGAGIAHEVGASLEVTCLVGLLIIMCIWFRVVDAVWDLAWVICAWALSGGSD